MSKLETGDVINIPTVAIEFMRERRSDFDQVMQINVRTSNVNRAKFVSRLFVNGAVRQIDGESTTNNYRGFLPADNKLFDAAEIENSWGIFEMSTDIGNENTGSMTSVRPFILGPTDKIIRLIGEDFLIVDPRTDLKPVAAQTLIPG